MMLTKNGIVCVSFLTSGRNVTSCVAIATKPVMCMHRHACTLKTYRLVTIRFKNINCVNCEATTSNVMYQDCIQMCSHRQKSKCVQCCDQVRSTQPGSCKYIRSVSTRNLTGLVSTRSAKGTATSGSGFIPTLPFLGND